VSDFGQSAQLIPALARVEQVDRDEPGMAGFSRWSPSQSDHLPVITLQQAFEDSPADHATSARNEGNFTLHGH
jgi:hypothetical protein